MYKLRWFYLQKKSYIYLILPISLHYKQKVFTLALKNIYSFINSGAKSSKSVETYRIKCSIYLLINTNEFLYYIVWRAILILILLNVRPINFFFFY